MVNDYTVNGSNSPILIFSLSSHWRSTLKEQSHFAVSFFFFFLLLFLRVDPSEPHWAQLFKHCNLNKLIKRSIH